MLSGFIGRPGRRIVAITWRLIWKGQSMDTCREGWRGKPLRHLEVPFFFFAWEQIWVLSEWNWWGGRSPELYWGTSCREGHRASEHEKWMQSRTVFQAGFHYVGSMNKMCQGKDRPLIVVCIFCTLSCNLEPGEIKTIKKKAQNFTVSLLWILHLLRFCFVRNPDKTGIVGLHENGAERNDLQSFWRKFTFT